MTTETRAAFPVEYEPRLVEEAVLTALRGAAREAAFRAERDRAYEVADPDAREARFRALHATWLDRLGLSAPLAVALREEPAVTRDVGRLVATLAPSARDEGADLFVAAGSETPDRARRTVVFRIRPQTLADPDRLLALCRRELAHVADLLDPAFGYAPGALSTDPGDPPEPLLRERYRVLWRLRVEGRLARRGVPLPGDPAERIRGLRATFPMLGARVEDLLERLLTGTLATHGALAAVARGPERALGLVRRGPHPGERCPLCRCPTHAFEPDPQTLSRAARERIVQGFPEWEPAHGLCRQCADLYRARAAAAAPAPAR